MLLLFQSATVFLLFVTFGETIQYRLGDPQVTLESFIISNTPSHTMKLFWGMDKTQMETCHVLFQEEDQDTYIEAMLKTVISEGVWSGT